MKIIHRVGFPAKDAESRALLTSLGIGLNDQPLLTTFEIEESDARWHEVAAWIGRSRPSDIARTVFTNAEIAAAQWLVLRPSWHHGYPQPDEGSFGYRKATYDLSDRCAACGIGLRQVAPFQMKKEPAWGKNSLLQLNWVFDEFFATPELWNEEFRPREVAARPVLGPQGRELVTVVQLVVQQTVAVATNGLVAVRCAVCGRVKYLPHTTGMFPRLAAEPGAVMVKTEQYFGSGADAHREILVGAGLGKALMAAKVKGATLMPVRMP